MSSQKQIREEITAKIVEALEKGVRPWSRPWSVSKNSGRPMNFVSHRLYQGINPLLLELHSIRFGLRSKWWATFRQWSDVGCTVKKRPNDVESGTVGGQHHSIPGHSRRPSRATRATRKSMNSCSCGPS